MKVKPARLRNRVSIHTRDVIKNDFGEQEHVFTTVVPEYRCSFKYSDGTTITEDTMVNKSQVVFSGRYRDSVMAGMYLLFKGDYYLINSVPPNEIFTQMSIICEAPDDRIQPSQS